jgi:hypothetical protein
MCHPDVKVKPPSGMLIVHGVEASVPIDENVQIDGDGLGSVIGRCDAHQPRGILRRAAAMTAAPGANSRLSETAPSKAPTPRITRSSLHSQRAVHAATDRPSLNPQATRSDRDVGIESPSSPPCCYSAFAARAGPISPA